MSAKAKFLKKLHEQQPCRDAFANKGQADIAEFRQRMVQLQEQIEEWLAPTEIRIDSEPVTLSDCLISGGPFIVPGISLRYTDRVIKFSPVFLYAQGVTGGVDVTLSADRRVVPLRRLFMRSTEGVNNWTCSPCDKLAGFRVPFSEDTFFETIANLIP